MHEYLRFFGTNNQQKVDHFLIYERGLLITLIKIIIKKIPIFLVGFVLLAQKKLLQNNFNHKTITLTTTEFIIILLKIF